MGDPFLRDQLDLNQLREATGESWFMKSALCFIGRQLLEIRRLLAERRPSEYGEKDGG